MGGRLGEGRAAWGEQEPQHSWKKELGVKLRQISWGGVQKCPREAPCGGGDPGADLSSVEVSQQEASAWNQGLQ